MGLLKAIGILVVGIFIGCTLTFISNEKQSNSDTSILHVEKTSADDKYQDLTLEKVEKSTTTKQAPCPQQCSQLSYDEKSKVNEFTSIIEENATLKQKFKVLEQKLRQSKQKINTLNRQVGELDESNITDEELLALVPKEYENLIVNFRGQMRDDIYDFHNQPEDLDEGFDLSHNISSFIVSHADSFGVELNSVICKKSYCELLIKEIERPSWDRIFQDLSRQDWWKFSSINSSSTSDVDENIVIYNFMSFQSIEEE